MAYEKIGFNKGDVLKAEHLNHMEEGIQLNSNYLLGNTNSLTPKQVYEAIISGRKVILEYTHEFFGNILFTNFAVALAMDALTAYAIALHNNQVGLVYIAGDFTLESGAWVCHTKILYSEDFTT